MTTVYGVAGVAAGIAGVILGLQAQKQVRESDAMSCPTYAVLGARCSQTGTNAMNNANTLGWLSTVGFGVSAASILTGLVMWAIPTEERPAPVAAWSWSVTGGPQGASGLLTRSF